MTESRPRKRVIYWLIISLILIITGLFILLKEIVSFQEITADKFIDYYTSKGYIVTYNQDNDSLSQNKYYIASRSDYDIKHYYITGDKNYLKKIEKEIKDNSKNKSLTYYLINDMLLYSVYDSQHKDTVTEYYNDLGYKITNTGPTLYGIGGILLILLLIMAKMRLYEKAGRKSWHSLIPILNNYIDCDLAFNKGILFLLFAVPGVNIIMVMLVNYNISKNFGKSTGFNIGMALIPCIFLPLLGFDDSKYKKNTISGNYIDNPISAKLVWKIFLWSVIIPFFGTTVLIIIMNLIGIKIPELISRFIIPIIQISIPILSIIFVIIPLVIIKILTKNK